MTTVYLETDDEITSAIAKLRAVTDGECVLLVPPGSRVATSRINFKLLAREANERKLNVAAVSDDPAVRALAVSAGLPTYDTIAAAEQALANFREQDRRLAERLGRSPTEVRDADESGELGSSTRSSDTSVMPSPVVDESLVAGVVENLRGEDGAHDADSVRSATFVAGRARMGADQARALDTQVLPGVEHREARRRARRVPVAPLLSVGLLALLVAGVAYGAYVLLPTATITLVPQTTVLRLDSFTVVADPGTAVVDPVAGTLPAQSIAVPLHVADTFDATGVQVSETKATGSVRFHSENTDHEVSIPLGTSVATEDEIVFVTTAPAIVPKADFATATRGTVNVPILAVRAGPGGNVAKATITLAPRSLSAQLVTVSNPSPTDGGERTEARRITKADYDGAVAALASRLDHAMATALADPNSVPRGLAAYPATATHDAPSADKPSSEFVGIVAPTFDLAVDATGHVLAVNEAVIDDIASARLDAAMATDQRAIGDAPVITFGPGEVASGLISYDVTASVLTYTAPDQQSLVNQVRGKTAIEAKNILSAFGAVDIVIWPDFIDRLPDQVSRISLTVTPPAAGS